MLQLPPARTMMSPDVMPWGIPSGIPPLGSRVGITNICNVSYSNITGASQSRPSQHGSDTVQ